MVSNFQFDPSLLDRYRAAFASQLPAFLPLQRWFGSKSRQIHKVDLLDYIPIQLSATVALITVARVEYTDGPGETYVLPLIPSPEGSASSKSSAPPILRVSKPESSLEVQFTDALANAEFLGKILDSIHGTNSHAGAIGELQAIPEPNLNALELEPSSRLVPRLIKAEQSNTSIIYGDRLILKFFRRIEEGVNPDLEIGRFLTEVAHFGNVPPLCGSLQYKAQGGKILALGILQGFVPNRGDAWRFTTDSLVELFTAAMQCGERDLARMADAAPMQLRNKLPAKLSDRLTKQLDFIGLLGKRTAEMHLALASSRSDAAFDPEPFTDEFRDALESSFHDLAVRNFEWLRQKLPELPDTIRELGKKVLALEDDVLLDFHSCLEEKIVCVRTRIHGDYHLGQVLFSGSDFFIIDFEGEPAKPLSERREKRSPIQDVAGILRSFHYAARSGMLAVRELLAASPKLEPALEQLAQHWYTLASQQFLGEYKKAASGSPFLPPTSGEFDRLLKLHLLEKAVYELGYELNNRPAWLPIPLAGIEEILEVDN